MAEKYYGYQFKPGDRCNIEQYRRLKRCSDHKDISEWNAWRDGNLSEEIWLSGAALRHAHLEGAEMWDAHLEGADLTQAHLEGADLMRAHLEGAYLMRAHLEGAIMWGAHLEGADLWTAHLEGAELNAATMRAARFNMVSVDGGTTLAACKIDRDTLFTGAALDNARVEPGLKQMLKYNIRRRRWRAWYNEGSPRLQHAKKAFVQPFWCMSDYGRSTGRIIVCFFGLAVLFAAFYYIWGLVDHPGIVDSLFEDQQGTIDPGYVPLRALYFSVVTMTTLGFGDMHAVARGVWGHLLLMLQVLLGYVLLAALVTRFAVLFQAGGPAGRFDEGKSTWERLRQTIRVDIKLIRRWLRRRTAAKAANGANKTKKKQEG